MQPVLVIILIAGLTIIAIPIMVTTITLESYALMQVAGNITVEIRPGEVKPFTWGLLSENQNQTTVVVLSADGNGSEFLSFPKKVTLSPGKLTEINGNVTIPAGYLSADRLELYPNIYATEVTEAVPTSGMIINVKMAKTLSIVIDQNQNI